jgi:hypothetical protein
MTKQSDWWVERHKELMNDNKSHTKIKLSEFSKCKTERNKEIAKLEKEIELLKEVYMIEQEARIEAENKNNKIMSSESKEGLTFSMSAFNDICRLYGWVKIEDVINIIKLSEDYFDEYRHYTVVIEQLKQLANKEKK